MKGRTATVAQKRFHDELRHRTGCIVCRTQYNTVRHDVAIHHVDGRTKPHAHWYVLPLCAGHHQHGTGDQGLIGRHATLRDGGRTAFEAAHGYEEVLFLSSVEELRTEGVDIPEGVKSILSGIIEDCQLDMGEEYRAWLSN